MASAHQLALLGPPHLKDRETGSYVRLPEKAWWLLAYLALAGKGGPIRRVHVAGLLWEDVRQETASANMRTLIARIRRIEAERAVSILEAGRLDVALAPDLEADVSRLLPLSRSPSLENALALCDVHRGDLLDGLEAPKGTALADWVQVARESLTRVVIGALESVLEHDHAALLRDVETVSRRLLSIDPYNEAACRGLVRAYSAAGQPEEARRAYDEFAHRLRTDLGAEPAGALAKLLADPPSAQAHKLLPDPSRSSIILREPAAGGGPAGAEAGIPRICILPPETSTRDGVFDLAAGLLDEVSVALCRLRTVTIIASHTAWQISCDAVDAARALRIDYLVTPRLIASSDRCALLVKLVRTSDREIIWADHFSFDLDNILQGYRELATTMARLLAGAVECEELRYADAGGQPSAYRLFLRAQSHRHKLDLRNVRRARQDYRQALSLAPQFSPAQAGFAHTLITEWLLLGRSDKEALREARRIAEAATGSDAIDHRGFRTLGRAEQFLGEMDRSLASFAAAERLSPGNPDTLADFADALMHVSRVSEALTKIEAAIERNPLPPDDYLWGAGGINFFLGNYAEALVYLRRMRDCSPAYKLMAACSAMLGHADDTERYVRLALEVHPEFRVDEWKAVIPLGPEETRHYVEALRKAGFH